MGLLLQRAARVQPAAAFTAFWWYYGHMVEGAV
jgi:hypothetical protein